MNLALIDNQKQLFKRITSDTYLIRENTVPPHPIGSERVLTILCLLPEHLYRNINCLLTLFKAADKNNSFFYDPFRLHSTIIGLGSNILLKESARDICAKAFLSCKKEPLQLRVQGVSAFPDTVVMPVLDLAGNLRELAHELAGEVVQAGIVSHENIGLHYDIWWTSLVRASPEAMNTFRSLIETNSSLIIGDFTVSEVQLVITDRIFSSQRTEIIARYPLG